MEITKELIAFVCVLAVVSALLGLGKISEDLFENILYLIIGGFVGWGSGYVKAKLSC